MPPLNDFISLSVDDGRAAPQKGGMNSINAKAKAPESYPGLFVWDLCDIQHLPSYMVPPRGIEPRFEE